MTVYTYVFTYAYVCIYIRVICDYVTVNLSKHFPQDVMTLKITSILKSLDNKVYIVEIVQSVGTLRVTFDLCIAACKHPLHVNV